MIEENQGQSFEGKEEYKQIKMPKRCVEIDMWVGDTSDQVTFTDSSIDIKTSNTRQDDLKDPVWWNSESKNTPIQEANNLDINIEGNRYSNA